MRFNLTKITYSLSYIVPSTEQESCIDTIQEKQDTNKSLITIYPGSVYRASVSYTTCEVMCTFSQENFNFTVLWNLCYKITVTCYDTDLYMGKNDY